MKPSLTCNGFLFEKLEDKSMEKEKNSSWYKTITSSVEHGGGMWWYGHAWPLVLIDDVTAESNSRMHLEVCKAILCPESANCSKTS